MFDDEHYVHAPQFAPRDGVERGEVSEFQLESAVAFPGAIRTIGLYVPAQYDGSARLACTSRSDRLVVGSPFRLFRELLADAQCRPRWGRTSRRVGRRDPIGQVHLMARVLGKASVAVHSSYLGKEEFAEAKLGHFAEVDEMVRAELRRRSVRSRVCVLPEGPREPLTSRGE